MSTITSTHCSPTQACGHKPMEVARAPLVQTVLPQGSGDTDCSPLVPSWVQDRPAPGMHRGGSWLSRGSR